MTLIRKLPAFQAVAAGLQRFARWALAPSGLIGQNALAVVGRDVLECGKFVFVVFDASFGDEGDTGDKGDFAAKTKEPRINTNNTNISCKDLLVCGFAQKPEGFCDLAKSQTIVKFLESKRGFRGKGKTLFGADIRPKKFPSPKKGEKP